MKYAFGGSVLIPIGRLRSEAVQISLRSEADYPAGDLRAVIKDNAIIGRFETAGNLTEIGITTLRNWVRGAKKKRES